MTADHALLQVFVLVAENGDGRHLAAGACGGGDTADPQGAALEPVDAQDLRDRLTSVEQRRHQATSMALPPPRPTTASTPLCRAAARAFWNSGRVGSPAMSCHTVTLAATRLERRDQRARRGNGLAGVVTRNTEAAPRAFRRPRSLSRARARTPGLRRRCRSSGDGDRRRPCHPPRDPTRIETSQPAPGGLIEAERNVATPRRARNQRPPATTRLAPVM